MSLFNLFKKAVNAVAPDTFDTRFSDIIEAAHKELHKNGAHYWSINVSDIQAYKEVAALPDKQKVEFIEYAVKRIYDHNKKRNSWTSGDVEWQRVQIGNAMMRQILKTKMILDDTDLLSIFTSFIQFPYYGQGTSLTIWPVNIALTQVEKQLKDRKPSLELVEGMKELAKLLSAENGGVYKDVLKLRERVAAIIYNAENENETRPVWFTEDDDFATYANASIKKIDAAEQAVWFLLMAHSQKASGGSPSKKYLDEAKNLFKELGADKFKQQVNNWFVHLVALKDKVTSSVYTHNGREYTNTHTEYLAVPNVDIVKGFVWMCVHFHDKTTLYNIASLAERAFKKIPGKGPAATAIGNACIYVLAHSKGLEGISYLSRLRLRIAQSNTQNLIEKYLNAAAKEQGVSIHEIEDMAVDDYGLEACERTFTFDDYKAVLRISGIGKTETSWYKPDGSLQKSVPAFVKEKHAAKLKKLKDAAKQIDATTSAQRDRIDRMFKSTRQLSWQQFTDYYWQHGLMRFIAEKLIWVFDNGTEKQAVIFHEGNWSHPNGNLSFTPNEATKVSLWHPVFFSVADIKEWRDFLLDKKIVQPIKQAYREVYLLTEAEINTRTYSNRMAAHLLKQHQFNSLAKIRGWKYSLMGGFDSGYNNGATLFLSEYNLVAQYWINEVNAEDAMSETGIWLYVATDQVRFSRANSNEVLELVDIPAVVFSEVMRDVDLFVGVASVGNDPAWRDSGGLAQYNNYWQSYSFGDLNELAKTRKVLLERLVPRLKIAKVSEIKDKFLVVKGKLRTYKIHIGSTNILMEPNDQYLCIVPDRSAKNTTENIFLPFEGDNGVSVILSKAFLLADDDKITDSTITSQINRK